MGDVTKQTTAVVKGLARFSNPYSQVEPGTLSQADNVISRRQGVLSPTPLNETLGLTVVEDQVPLRMFGNWNYPFFASVESNLGDGDFSIRFSDDDPNRYNTVPLGTTPRHLRFAAGETQATNSRDRLIFTEYNAPILRDTTDPSPAPRVVGLPPPALIIPFLTANSPIHPNILTGGNLTSYKCVFRRVRDTYEITSAPSMALATGTNAMDAAVSLSVSWDSRIDPIIEDDYLIVYRVHQHPTLDELDDNYRECIKWKLSAADIAADGVVLFDNVLEADLDAGAPLYSNAEQEGATQVNLMPPPSRDTATYNDTTFYVSKNSWPIVTVTVPGLMGTLTTAQDRRNGIGHRAVAGNISSVGSFFVTGVSATDILGIVPGQEVFDTSIFVQGTRVVAITGAGPFSIQMSQPALVSGAVNVDIYDRIQINAVQDGSTTSESFLIDGAPWQLAGRLLLATSCLGFRVDNLNGNAQTSSTAGTGVKFQIWSPISGVWDAFSVFATNAQNYVSTQAAATGTSITFESIQDTRTNRIYFSKTSLPESVAPVNFLDAGNETVLKIWPTESALFAYCTDGLWRITGVGTEWQVNQIDRSVSLVHPNCVGNLDNLIFALVEDGIATTNEDGVTTISTEAIGADLRAQIKSLRQITVDSGDAFVWGPDLIGDHFNNELWLNLAHVYTSEGPNVDRIQTYLLNKDTGTFTTQSQATWSSVVYAPYKHAMVFGGLPDYTTPSTNQWSACSVTWNPFTAGDLGTLKQWVDVNLLFDDFEFSDLPALGTIQFIFDETIDGNNSRSVDATSGKKLHCWIPRRCSLKEQLVVGFRVDIENHPAPNFSLFGITLRSRVASDTLKR